MIKEIGSVRRLKEMAVNTFVQINKDLDALPPLLKKEYEKAQKSFSADTAFNADIAGDKAVSVLTKVAHSIISNLGFDPKNPDDGNLDDFESDGGSHDVYGSAEFLFTQGKTDVFGEVGFDFDFNFKGKCSIYVMLTVGKTKVLNFEKKWAPKTPPTGLSEDLIKKAQAGVLKAKKFLAKVK